LKVSFGPSLSTMTEMYNLSWSNFQKHTSSAFHDLLEQSDFVDVTLACEEDKHITAHKIILSACSPFFRNILQRNHHQRPLIFLDGVKHKELVAIIDFIYLGQAEVTREGIEEFMRVGRKLKIRGLDTEEIPNGTTKTRTDGNANETENSKTEENEAKITDNQTHSTETGKIEEKFESRLLEENKDEAGVSYDKDFLEEAFFVNNLAQKSSEDSKNMTSIDDTVINVVINSDKVTEKFEHKATEISDMLKGDLVVSGGTGLALTQKKEVIPKSQPKPKKKTKDQGFSCDLCDFKAAEVGNLRMHTFYKHGGKTYSCDLCDFKAQRQTGLNFHKKMKHGHYGK